MKFRVTTLSAAGDDRVVVNFTQVNDETDGANAPVVNFAGGNLSITLDSKEAKSYWPNQDYKLSLTAVKST